MKQIVFLMISILLAINVSAQDAEAQLEPTKTKKESDKKLIDKLTFGGGIGLSIGSYTRIAAAPIIGYRPIDRIMLGVEGRYAYIKDSYNGFKTQYYGFKTQYYGFGPLARVILFKGIFFQAQAEFLNYDEIMYNSYNSHRIWTNAVLLGGGYRQPLNKRSYYFVTVLWNINDTGTSIYVNNPIIRMGITF